MSNTKATFSVVRRQVVQYGVVACAMGIAGLASSPAMAQGYPSKPITMLVPWAAGGGTDAVARAVAAAMEKDLGVVINVVNRQGGSGVVGLNAIVSAKPDGYTISLFSGELTMMHWQNLTNLTYQDITPVGMVNFDYAGLQVSSESPYQSAKDLLAAVAADSTGTFKASGTGQGGIWHLALTGLLLNQQMPADQVTWIPSQGAAPAMVELASGGIQIVPSALAEGRAMIEAGRSRPLAVMAPERNPSFPEVPTLKEQLGTDYTIGTWRGVIGPKGMDPAIVARLEQAVKVAYDSEFYQSFIKNQGFGAEYRDAESFGEFLVENDAFMGELLRESGLAKK